MNISINKKKEIMKKISRSKQRRIEEKRLNENLFNKLSNLSNDQKIEMRTELLINPIQVTYSIGSDSYIRNIVDFKRNGKILYTLNKNQL